MRLNWNEIKSRELHFSQEWADACNENSQAKPFWIAFFEIFGITNKRVATFELNCCRRSNIDHLCRLNFDQGLLSAFGLLTVDNYTFNRWH